MPHLRHFNMPVHHLNLLLLQLQFPNLRGLPLLDITTVGADGSESIAQRTYTKSGGNNWPHVKVEGKSCCALQLMGLVQFKVIKRHPQEKGKKYIPKKVHFPCPICGISICQSTKGRHDREDATHLYAVLELRKRQHATPPITYMRLTDFQ